MVECKRERNLERCNCTYTCNKKGMCCDCLQYHLKSGEFPACFFPDDIEQTYDRSIETFIKVYQERGPFW
jgi:hypothetical protein